MSDVMLMADIAAGNDGDREDDADDTTKDSRRFVAAAVVACPGSVAFPRGSDADTGNKLSS